MSGLSLGDQGTAGRLVGPLGAAPERMLPTVWALVDDDGSVTGRPGGVLVPDVEGLCRAVLIRALRKSRQPISHADFQHTLGFALGRVWELKPVFDPEKGATRGGSFRGWLYHALYFDVLDFWEKWYGKDGRHRVGLGQPGPGDLDDGDPRADRLVDAAAGDVLDRVDARGWLHSAADRNGDGPVDRGGLQAGPRADGGAGRTGARPGGRAAAAAASTGQGAAAFVDCPGCGERCFAQPPNGLDRWHYPPCRWCGTELEP